MSIRQFIAAIMILLSLSAQARTAFACGMMPGAALPVCCCDEDGGKQCPPAAPDNHCCDEIAASDAPLAHEAGRADRGHHAPAAPLDLPPPGAVASHWPPAWFDAGGMHPVSPAADADRHRVRPLYLQTARLRL